MGFTQVFDEAIRCIDIYGICSYIDATNKGEHYVGNS